jgi:hypothetical protein
VEKVRDGVAGEAFPFELEVVDLGADEDGDAVTTCLAVTAEAVPAGRQALPPRALSGVAKTALQALHEAASEHGERMVGTSTIPAGVVAVRIERWAERFDLRYGAEGDRSSEAVRKAFQRGREALLKASAVGISKPYAWVPR